MSDFTLHNEATRAVDFKPLKVNSTAFNNDGMIPVAFTCDGSNISPPLDIDHIPEEAKCLVLIVDDPDASVGTWVHWIVWNIPVTHHIKENQVHGIKGMNDFQQYDYSGPCPPSGTHHYFYKVYALDALLNLPANTRKPQLEKEMSKHIIAFGELVGLYKRDQ
ncbi:YbhB/YbcL family Raf kinase inhibitor-like protein [Panacibacter ginsenosidivorans]|uniref:YbhB/YbcL family Raf kinase inhibitor-like protein n=1 Tax=Panacibacter ginsenosidivorans TaxID=1813871 RepID=A0A5B8V306_9BACT|nr:YbhB/YbcL family Raf kinase inhibitor-like protein [Panacibacter ginsenosidivorans]QEC65800.1 YbhB/YbcL family Raf kinase inhibitor-like protein [Panacibacter ginsenosidivorans]